MCQRYECLETGLFQKRAPSIVLKTARLNSPAALSSCIFLCFKMSIHKPPPPKKKLCIQMLDHFLCSRNELRDLYLWAIYSFGWFKAHRRNRSDCLRQRKRRRGWGEGGRMVGERGGGRGAEPTNVSDWKNKIIREEIKTKRIEENMPGQIWCEIVFSSP